MKFLPAVALVLMVIGGSNVQAQGLTFPTVAFTAGALSDAASTVYALNANPRAREADPLYAWAGHNPPVLVAVAAGVDVLTVLLARRVGRTHPKIAAASLYIAAGFRMVTAAQNVSAAHQNALLPH